MRLEIFTVKVREGQTWAAINEVSFSWTTENGPPIQRRIASLPASPRIEPLLYFVRLQTFGLIDQR